MEEKIGFGYYVVIPTALLMDENVSPNAKLCFGMIANLSNQRGYCFASNRYISELMNVHEMTISKYVSELIKNNYLIKFDEVTQYGLQRRLAISDIIKSELPKSKELDRSAKSIRGGNENQLGGVSENNYHNIQSKIVKKNIYEEDKKTAYVKKDLDWYKSQFDDIYLDILKNTHPTKANQIDKAIKESFVYLMNKDIATADKSRCRILLNTWMANLDSKEENKHSFGNSKPQWHGGVKCS